jgi:hypothetical protein
MKIKYQETMIQDFLVAERRMQDLILCQKYEVPRQPVTSCAAGEKDDRF